VAWERRRGPGYVSRRLKLAEPPISILEKFVSNEPGRHGKSQSYVQLSINGSRKLHDGANVMLGVDDVGMKYSPTGLCDLLKIRVKWSAKDFCLKSCKTLDHRVFIAQAIFMQSSTFG
jgi:hypothetical protein